MDKKMLSNCSSNFELNSIDGDEVTAFMHACENGHKVVVKMRHFW